MNFVAALTSRIHHPGCIVVIHGVVVISSTLATTTPHTLENSAIQVLPALHRHTRLLHTYHHPVNAMSVFASPPCGSQLTRQSAKMINKSGLAVGIVTLLLFVVLVALLGSPRVRNWLAMAILGAMYAAVVVRDGVRGGMEAIRGAIGGFWDWVRFLWLELHEG